MLFCAVAACGRSNGPAVLASAMIGPFGGELVVTTGEQAGLKLVVPAGAVPDPTEIRIVDAPQVVSGAPVLATTPGVPFRIEPETLRLEVLGTLEAPYRLQALSNTAAGNVRFEQLREGITRIYEPASVDVAAGRATMPLRTFGRYQIVTGPVVSDIAAYRPMLGSSVSLENGITFSVEQVGLEVPAALRGATVQRWRITGPGFNDSLFFDGDLMLGRESAPPGWFEVWQNPALVWQDLRGTPPFAVTTAISVQYPVIGLSSGGLMTVFGTWNWSEPRFVGPQLVYDVLQLTVSLAFERQDLGTGQRIYRFLFSPEMGLIGIVQDGVTSMRLPQ